ncbi:NAD-dependent epimerase/dehydratase family protein [Pedobacter nanyangensis]|uniref:NAD-dependent epimerase/dehydratase family protein n=1 Tax=Pedobacter nanyangensis TaxID=1562389 RepID=UPI000DE50474|nr:NAD-dependent epimerase/dehydratase family protein [Pedobacter nanyangensis]
MKILITGASGFLGKEIVREIANEHTLVSLGRHSADIEVDLFFQIPKLDFFDLVIHAAGKAHSVPKTAAEKQEFFNVNVVGTENLLKGLEEAPSLPKSFVFISSVSVYGIESGTNINESCHLNATDPYGLSKIQAEQIVKDWCTKNNVTCSILRLPLLVGSNPPGNLGAMIRGIKKGYYFNIAGGAARKSMVMAEDVAKIIPKLTELGGVYNLTDGYHPSFNKLSKHIANQLGKKNVPNMPKPIAVLLARIGDLIPKFPLNSGKFFKITSDLTFNDDSARSLLDWSPRPVLEAFKLSQSFP